MSKPVFNTTWIQPKKPDNFDIKDHELLFKQRNYSLPLVKTHITNTCRAPFNNLAVDNKGRVFNCKCSGHVPFVAGLATDFNTFEEVFNSPMALKNQESVTKKEFEYCATDVCGIEAGDIIAKPGYIYLALEIDHSCNFSCPSCRERMIFINDSELLDKIAVYTDRISQWIKTTDKLVIIEFSGGEPFASLVYSKLISEWLTYKNVNMNIRTNGSLIKQNLSKLVDLDNMIENITLSISIDAASKEVYEQVRRGGKWDSLLQNLEYVKQLTIKYPSLKVAASFVVQKDNINDMIPFVKFCKDFNITPNFTPLEDWGTWHNYHDHCIHLPSSPYYRQFLDIINELKQVCSQSNMLRLSAFI